MKLARPADASTPPAAVVSGRPLERRLRSLAHWLLGREDTAGLGGRLAVNATGTLAMRIASTGLYFVITVLLARWLGATGYGMYAYVMAWLICLEIPAVMGFDRVLVRDVAAYRAQGAWSLVNGLLRRASQLALAASLALTVVVAALSAALSSHVDVRMLSTFGVAALLLPLKTFMNLSGAAMRGFDRIVLGQVADMIIRPVVFIALVGAVHLGAGERLSPSLGMGMNVLATAIALVVAARLWYTHVPQDVSNAAPVFRTAAWLRSAWSLLLITGLHSVSSRADTLMLGAISGVEEVGVYTVAARGAEVVGFVLGAANIALGPTIAGLYGRGERSLMQRLVTKNVRVTTLVALPTAAGLIVFAREYLLLFGPDFTRGQLALGLLTVAQLVNVAMGPVGLLLVMTGHERDLTVVMAASAVATVALNGALIPWWGLDGAAAATATTTIVWNVVLAMLVYKRLGVYAPALGMIRRDRVER